MELVERCNSNMVSCSLCDKIITLEYKEMEGHMSQKHGLSMHRCIQIFVREFCYLHIIDAKKF